MDRLLQTLTSELERPRQLSTKVVNYIAGTYEIDREAIGLFLTHEFSDLEDDEIDLILSPVFTPKLADQAVFAELLGGKSVPRDAWPTLIQQLAARPTHARLVTTDNQTHSVALREVTIERYVQRLRLDGAIPDSLLTLIDAASSADRPLLKAVARRAVWETDERRGILEHYLATASATGEYRVTDAVDLLNLVENYKPANVADVLARIPHLQDVLKQEIRVAFGPKPFFSGHIQESHGGEHDQRNLDDARRSVKESELVFLDRLRKIMSFQAGTSRSDCR